MIKLYRPSRAVLFAAGVLAAVGVIAVGAHPADATTTDVVAINTATIGNTPDDGCPAWARDTFQRKTVIRTTDAPGAYLIHIDDWGTFTTQAGAKTPGDATADIIGGATGHITGEGEFRVIGTPKTVAEIQAMGGFDNSAYACKGGGSTPVPADRTTGQWPLRFFAPGATVDTITNWKWIYHRPCEDRIEQVSGAVGNITGKVCPPTPKPSTSASKSASPKPSGSVTSPAASPTATKTAPPYTSPTATTPGVTPAVSLTPAAVTGGSLPVTGPAVAVLIAIGLVAVAGGGALLWRNRRREATDFTAE